MGEGVSGPRRDWRKDQNRARARRAPGAMNKTERAFADYLDARLLSGEIIWWEYQPISLKFAWKNNRVSYSLDFGVVFADATIGLYEVKGTQGWKLDSESRTKFMEAVERYPMFRLIAAFKQRVKDGGGFKETEHFPTKPFGHWGEEDEEGIDA